jgi:hypothetical protein
MKFAFLIMYELRSINKTIEYLNKYIIDYYNTDIFLLCQESSFPQKDIENLNLFNKNIKHNEIYKKPKISDVFNYDIEKFYKPLHNGENWNKYSCLQVSVY